MVSLRLSFRRIRFSHLDILIAKDIPRTWDFLPCNDIYQKSVYDVSLPIILGTFRISVSSTSMTVASSLQILRRLRHVPRGYLLRLLVSRMHPPIRHLLSFCLHQEETSILLLTLALAHRNVQSAAVHTL